MNRTFVLVVLALVLGSAFADAQVIRPRGAAPKAEAAVADAGTAPAVAAVANSPAERPVVAVAAPLVPDARDVKIAELRQELRTIIHENPAHAGTIAELKQVRDTAIAEASGKYALMTMTVISAVLFLLGISIGWILRGRKAPKSGDGEPVTFDSPRRMTTVAPERTPVDETRLTKAVDKALHPPMTTVVVLGLALGLASGRRHSLLRKWWPRRPFAPSAPSTSARC